MANVLIVEDDAILAHCIEAHLNQEDFGVEVVCSTFAALDRMDLRKFAVIVADIGMPEGMPNGLSLARMARIRDPQCRIILMSGYSDLAKEGDRLGARVFVKPVDLDDLAAAIRQEIAPSAGEARGD